MLNRRLCFALALVFAASHTAAAQGGRAPVRFPTWHSRQGDLPPMITTRSEVESLVADIIAVASSVEAIDTVDSGEITVSVLGFDTAGRGVSADLPAKQALDTLHWYLGPTSGLSRISVNLRDSRMVRPRGNLLNQSRVGTVSLRLINSTDKRASGYMVTGDDKQRVDKIGDEIEAFAKQHRTWRGPEGGEIAKNGSIALALLLLPMALVLRDRRGIWLLYPVSAALFASAYLFPFAVVFNNLVIAAGH